MESVLTDASFPGRFSRAPVFDLWVLLHHAVLFRVYSALAKELPNLWRSECDKEYPEKDTQFGTHFLASTFGEFMQMTRTSKYGTTGSVRTYTHDESRWTGDQMLTEYFKLWDESSWVYGDVNSDGVVQDLIDKGLAGGGSGPGTLNVTDFYTDTQWYTKYETYKTGGSWRGATIIEDLKEYINKEQQPEILEFFNLAADESRIVVGVKNDSKQATQKYDRDFVVEAQIDYDNLIVGKITYLGDDTTTQTAMNFR